MGHQYEVLETGDGEITTMIVTSKENSSFTVMHSRLKAGARTLRNYHEYDYEAFYVVSGSIRFIAGNESQLTHEGGPGNIIVIPPKHYRSLVASKESIVLRINYPSGPGEYFIRDLSSTITTHHHRRLTIEDTKRFRTKYGIHVVTTSTTTPVVKNPTSSSSSITNHNHHYRPSTGKQQQQQQQKQQQQQEEEEDLERPTVGDLMRDRRPVIVGGLRFSLRMGEQEEEDDDVADNHGPSRRTRRSTILFAYATTNKRPHSLPLNETDSPDVFCITRS